MGLDPILARLIKKAYANGFGDLHRLEPQAMRRFLTHPKLKEKNAIFQDFRTNNGLTLRCYSPKDFSLQPLPAIIYLSANAFVLDRLEASNDYCSLIAMHSKCKVINIAHRLAPEHKFPDFLYDCLESIEWVYHSHQLLNIFQNQIALWGESSGASIGATCTHLLRNKKLPIISHQVLFYPMVDLINNYPSKIAYEKGYMLDKSFIQWLDNMGFHPQQNRGSPLVSPLLFSDFSGLPNATIITAEFDPLRDEGEEYVKKLRAANILVEHHLFKGMIHGFMRFYPKVNATKNALLIACNRLQSIFQS